MKSRIPFSNTGVIRRVWEVCIMYQLLWIVFLALSATGQDTHGDKKLPMYVPTRGLDYKGPLWKYTYTYDNNFNYEAYANGTYTEGVTSYTLNMTSQKWFDERLSNRPLWWHSMVIHVPDERDPRYIDAVFFQIAHYDNVNGVPPNMGSTHIRRTRQLAKTMKAITAVIHQVPNQPIRYENKTLPFEEDSAITWTWRKFYNLTLENIYAPDINLYAPMLKASARAMDTIQHFVSSNVQPPSTITRFVVAGESKRGWTTWILAAFDDRIVAIVPEVLSCLDIQSTFMHYYQSFGGWPVAMLAYWLQDLMSFAGEPGMSTLIHISDPFSYNQWLTMPVLMIAAASDEFFLLDDSHYFWDKLTTKKKNIWILEDTGHTINNGPLADDMWKVLELYFASIIYPDVFIPQFDYILDTTDSGGSITVTVDPSSTLKNISVYSAMSISTERRDWRQAIIQPTGIEWTRGAVNDQGGGTYRVSLNNPPLGTGYLAFFVKLQFEGVNGKDWFLSTEAVILPNTFPYPPCEGTSCQGTLT